MTPLTVAYRHSTQYDPITPLDGAQAFAGYLGESAALVELNGFGVRTRLLMCSYAARYDADALVKHATILTAPSVCIDDIMIAYMVNGTVRLKFSLASPSFGADSTLQTPTNNTVCEVDADFELFKGVNNANVLANLPPYDV